MALKQASGKVRLLRVHEVGSGFGPPADAVDVEVVFKVEDEEAIGFQLRHDDNGLVHQGMLDLLRDAVSHDWTVHTDYEIADGKRNGTALRVWLTRDRPPQVPGESVTPPVLKRIVK